jgi:hypothetical protein
MLAQLTTDEAVSISSFSLLFNSSILRLCSCWGHVGTVLSVFLLEHGLKKLSEARYIRHLELAEKSHVTDILFALDVICRKLMISSGSYMEPTKFCSICASYSRTYIRKGLVACPFRCAISYIIRLPRARIRSDRAY